MIDPIRHLSVFAPHSFQDRIDIVGVGATGSRIALSLAKLGITNIHIWDHDVIEAHNVANQVYGNTHIGRLKVEALKEIIVAETGIEVIAHAERVDGSQRLGSVVFVLTDTMASRQEIWKRALRYKPHAKLMIETRMGSNNGRVYTVNPCAPPHVTGWEKTLCSDDAAEVSACGTSVSVGPTAEIVSGLAVWQFIRWHQALEKAKSSQSVTDEPEHELVFSLQPMQVIGLNFPD